MKRTRYDADIELRSLDTEERSIEGLAVVFNREADLGYFYESIDPHAFDNCDMSDVYLLFNHDDNYPLARTLNGSLTLSVDDKGLSHRAQLVATSVGNDVYKLVKEGLINKMSFAFTIDGENGEEWRTDHNGVEHRTIKRISKLYDVSVVTYPSYGDTEVNALRSIDQLDDLAKEHLQKRSLQMNEEKLEAVVAPEAEEQPEVLELEEAPIVEEPQPQAEVVAEEPQPEMAEAEQPEAEQPQVEEPREEERKMNTTFNVEQREAVNYRSTPEYRSAWVKHITGKGDDAINAIKEERGLTTASATLVPTYIAEKIAHSWEANKMLGLVSVTLSSANLTFPVESSSTGAVFHTEGAAAPEEQVLEIVDKLFIQRMAKKWLSITDELMMGSEEAIMDYVAEEIGYHILQLVNNSIINGQLASGKGIEGILNSSLVNPVTGGDLDATTIYKGLATLVDVDAPVVVMNPTDFYNKVMGLLDTTGRPIFSAIGEERYINGCRVVLQSAVPTNKMIVGDLSAFRLIAESREPRIVYDPYTSAREDKVNVIGKMLVSGGVVKANKLAVITFTA